ncbi:hypothetical protein QSJ18_18580 [Gordonia sp. ABSL1-1]|uniref:hypothetical protein n=1 Tax=Gordonia sp. ABSL1-1 TaxID=3053923 RepID=UPI002574881B|nr:hypothetical protein [Gordonia sp. ABSL1-1]MDL9938757.1 hypothetical protein [Gordonia sp. ABSL1-1]
MSDSYFDSRNNERLGRPQVIKEPGMGVEVGYRSDPRNNGSNSDLYEFTFKAVGDQPFQINVREDGDGCPTLVIRIEGMVEFTSWESALGWLVNRMNNEH